MLMYSAAFSQVTKRDDSTTAKSKLFNVFSYKISEMPIEDALLYIAEKSNISVAFSRDIFPKDKLVTLDLKNSTAEEALETLIHGTNTSLVSISKNRFAVTERKALQLESGYKR